LLARLCAIHPFCILGVLASSSLGPLLSFGFSDHIVFADCALHSSPFDLSIARALLLLLLLQ